MPCPNAPHAHSHQPRTPRFKCFAVAFAFLYRDKWPDPAKFHRRARHAVPLLKKMQLLKNETMLAPGIAIVLC